MDLRRMKFKTLERLMRLPRERQVIEVRYYRTNKVMVWHPATWPREEKQGHGLAFERTKMIKLESLAYDTGRRAVHFMQTHSSPYPGQINLGTWYETRYACEEKYKITNALKAAIR